MSTSIEANARRVLLALATFGRSADDPERGQHALEGAELETVSGLKGSGLQDVVDFLDNRRLIKRQRFVGDPVGLVRLNAEGRVEAERLMQTRDRSDNASPAEPSPRSAFDMRREILEELHKLNAESPQATGMWSAERGDPESAARVREAEYLKERGYVSGQIGGDGYLALRITASGRDYVEAGGFWTKTERPPLAAEDPSAKPEHKLPRLEVTYVGKLGQGAFGSVWRATDVLLERDIAVKFLTSTDQAMDEQALIREARSLAKLSHPNLVIVHAAAWLRHPETKLLAPALMMELLHGATLDEWWSHAHSREEVLWVASGLVAGVIATHAAGLVHGDIHEGNVMVLENATAKLIDWRYHDTFLQRSTSHRHSEMAAEYRRVLDRLDILFSKQNMEAERIALRGKADLQAVAMTLDELAAAHPTAPTPIPPTPLPPIKQRLETAIQAARSSAVIIAGGVIDPSTRRDAVNGEIQLGPRDNDTFQIRIPCGRGGIPLLRVPYELVRSAWVDDAGRLNVALEWPLVWNGDEVIFDRGQR